MDRVMNIVKVIFIGAVLDEPDGQPVLLQGNSPAGAADEMCASSGIHKTVRLDNAMAGDIFHFDGTDFPVPIGIDLANRRFQPQVHAGFVQCLIQGENKPCR